jgi:hypothetical protein
MELRTRISALTGTRSDLLVLAVVCGSCVLCFLDGSSSIVEWCGAAVADTTEQQKIYAYEVSVPIRRLIQQQHSVVDEMMENDMPLLLTVSHYVYPSPRLTDFDDAAAQPQLQQQLPECVPLPPIVLTCPRGQTAGGLRKDLCTHVGGLLPDDLRLRASFELCRVIMGPPQGDSESTSTSHRLTIDKHPLDDTHHLIDLMIGVRSPLLSLALVWPHSCDPASRCTVSVINKSEMIVDHISSTSKTSTTLKDSLSSLICEEQLDETNGWLCPRCRTRRPAYKQLQLYRLPRVCVIHLKRFQITDSGRKKINDPVAFDINGLDLSPFLCRDIPPGSRALYDLFAICHHLGSIEWGHYTSTVKHASTGVWYDFSDCNIALSRPSDMQMQWNHTAYLLFYELRDEEK